MRALLAALVLGFVFQDFPLIPTPAVAENIELPLLFLNRRIHAEKTRASLEAVGLTDSATQLRSELSGGQMQRVAIARA